MAVDLNNPFTEKYVCKVLLKNGLISQDQVKEIFKKSISVERKLAKKNVGQQVSFASGAKSAVSTNIIDIIDYLKLSRADGKSGLIDEETIYQVMAKEWKIPYKKIDPHDQRYWVYPIGLAIFGLIYLIQRPRIPKPGTVPAS